MCCQRHTGWTYFSSSSVGLCGHLVQFPCWTRRPSTAHWGLVRQRLTQGPLTVWNIRWRCLGENFSATLPPTHAIYSVFYYFRINSMWVVVIAFFFNQCLVIITFVLLFYFLFFLSEVPWSVCSSLFTVLILENGCSLSLRQVVQSFWHSLLKYIDKWSQESLVLVMYEMGAEEILYKFLPVTVDEIS